MAGRHAPGPGQAGRGPHHRAGGAVQRIDGGLRMRFEFDARTEELRGRVSDFMDGHVYPAEPVLAEQLAAQEGWTTPPIVAELRTAARAQGLWNLFLPGHSGGAGLTNLQYAPLAELMGRSPTLG